MSQRTRRLLTSVMREDSVWISIRSDVGGKTVHAVQSTRMAERWLEGKIGVLKKKGSCSSVYVYSCVHARARMCVFEVLR